MSSVTEYEWKQIEGQRIMAALGGAAALPAAGLLTGTGQGAPLFAAALASVTAAYHCWLLTDWTYHLSIKLKAADLLSLYRPRLIRFGVPAQYATLLHIVIAVIATLLGFAGERTALTTGISAEAGFIAALIYASGLGVNSLAFMVAQSRLNRDALAAIRAVHD